MSEYICCPKCGSKKLQTATEPNKSYRTCSACGYTFEGLESLQTKAKVSRTISKSILLFTGVVGLIIGFSLYLPLSIYDKSLAICMFLIVEAIMLGAGLLGMVVNGRNADRLDEQVAQLESRMNSFKGKAEKQSDSPRSEKEAFVSAQDKKTATYHYKTKSYLKPVKVLKHGTGLINCPVCGAEQEETGSFCIACQTPFINRQPETPYWCNNCSKPGPYGNFCPNCGSAEKIIND